MNVLVCVKVVEGELNPFDECALEEALKIPESSVYVVSMSPMSANDKLHSLTRLGVKKVFVLSDSLYAGSDTLATSYILSEWIKKQSFDMIFCGRQTIDGDTAQVGPCLATILGYNLITNVMEITEIGDMVKCKTRMGDEEVKLPALLTVERINTLRFPSIFSKLGEIEVLNNSVVGADASKCGLKGSPTKVLKTFENSSGMRNCKFISPSEFKTLFDMLLKKERSEIEFPKSSVKMKSVWAIGDEVSEKAYEIAEKVEIINEKDPYKIAEMAREKKPSVILWNADLWGRKNAPIVSAILETGLCADCTHLETDGEKLYMYRPAKSGNIIAKIECRTYPQMATVRCKQKSDDIVVSGGRGVYECFDKVENFAKEINAELCASRALVDKNIVPYEMQVGLTGITISPKIYIAIGISGAAQHTCAIESADTIIAINPDKDAPIFNFSDYGIVCGFEEFYNLF